MSYLLVMAAALPIALPADPAAGDAIGPQSRHALILCGLPGDAEHREMFTAVVDRLASGLVENVGFDPSRVTVLFGSEPMQADDGPRPQSTAGPCTAQSVRAATAELQERLTPADGLWVFVIGHAYFDGRHSWFNVAGSDIEQDQFGRLFADLRAGEAVFWVTTPASGFYVRPLAGEGRVVITATEPDREINETTFATHLADVLAEPPAMAELDADEDERISLLDVYLVTARRVAAAYAADNALPTEHARLDDTGDGRSREIQKDYLPEELGGTTAPRTGPPTAGADGSHAAAIVLPIQPGPDAPAPTNDSPDSPAVAEKPTA